MIPQDESTRCDVCGSGKQPAVDNAMCEDCPAGTATSGNTDGNCVPCVDGEIPVENGARCEVCPPGKEQGEGGTVCVMCELGEASSTGQCTACSRGKVPTAEQSQCQMCASGKEPAGNLSTCVNCPAGSASSVGQCQPCLAGQRPVQTAAGPNNLCQTCDPGSVSTDNIVCEICALGTKPNSIVRPTLCEPCEAGRFRSETTAGVTCEVCPQGTTPNPDHTDCQGCPPGFASPTGQCAAC
eukprot:COSAG06_NODE_13962_length_1202_cov_0.858568_1_plen_239_part_10